MGKQLSGSQGLDSELSQVAMELIEENKSAYPPHDVQRLIDHVTALLRDFKEDGFSHLQIKETVTQLAQRLHA